MGNIDYYGCLERSCWIDSDLFLFQTNPFTHRNDKYENKAIVSAASPTIIKTKIV